MSRAVNGREEDSCSPRAKHAQPLNSAPVQLRRRGWPNGTVNDRKGEHMSDRTYYLGILPGDYDGYRHRHDTLVLQARESPDCLSCELYQYLGARVVTKKHLRAQRSGILSMLNREHGYNFKRLIVD